ncbi:proton-dependent oligopeptide transporter, POT family [Arachidicoccus rhizosphaerae]|jgi:POT family proton-dependent oligopeptide transporter|uniref:Proton-dependent oligopeptide transporter, POT family n=1 Tax=Arachidicoccus rhizosphaerae TaxID=551991 RepID=A0A1H4C8Y6_9BACT|nr:peptide MFS transporter [Arachidicoccus rhizosphaerae]SEA56769.1 proton-dependent oligopeptide transporter, POT family [Arachidicoccus rhizosphaerae]
MAKQLTLEQIQNFKGKYPKQIWYMFLVEMWERFCFYGMRGVLTIFMVDQVTGGLGLSERSANLQYGTIQAFVYAFTFVGGLFADKILGFKRSLVFGALVMIAGNFIIAFNPHTFFYIGITFSVIGTGFFKPNITSMVGYLYKDGDHRRDAGFSLFYSGINLGALLGGALCVYLGKSPEYGWAYAFMAAGTVMIIGLVTFLLTKKYIQPIGNKPGTEENLHIVEMEQTQQVVEADVKPVKPQGWWKEYLVYLGALASIPIILVLIKNENFTTVFMYSLAAVAVLYFLFELFRQKEVGAKSKLIAAFIFIFFYFVFETFFEQAGGSLAIFADKNLHHRMLGFLTIDPNIVNNSANSFFVCIFGALMGLFWLWLAKGKKEPNTINKFGIAFLLMALSYYLFYYLRYTADDKGLTSLGIFTLAYFVISIAELCLSPIGMSIVTKLSPKKLQGVMIGMWFLASAYGQYGAGLLGASMSAAEPAKAAHQATAAEIIKQNFDRLYSYTDGYKQMAIYCLVAGLLLIICASLIKKLMRGVR